MNEDKYELQAAAIKFHIDKILNVDFIAAQKENIQRLAADFNIHAVVDAVNAAGSKAVPALLARLGIDCKELYCIPDGTFYRQPEPLAENLADLRYYINQLNAKTGGDINYIGFATDPDADRLAIVNELGDPVGEELTIAMALDSYWTLNPSCPAPAVVNHSTTMLCDHIANTHGKTLLRAPVGEINVVEKMKATNAKIGGEGSGGVILANCHHGRDSLVGITLTLALLAKSRMLMWEYLAGYPQYIMIKEKIPLESLQSHTGQPLAPQAIVDFVGQFFPESQRLNTDADGVKITAGPQNGWFHLRASNTEPTLRLIMEATSKAQIEHFKYELNRAFEQI